MVWLLAATSFAVALAQAPLTAADLGPEWVFVVDDWVDSEWGSGYGATFRRDVRAGLSGTGPIIVSMGVNLLFEAPSPEAVDVVVTAQLAASQPTGEVTSFEGPAVGTNTRWYSHEADLTAIAPLSAPPGILHNVVFESGTNLATVTTIGFAGRTGPEDAVRIAAIVDNRMRDFQLIAPVP